MKEKNRKQTYKGKIIVMELCVLLIVLLKLGKLHVDYIMLLTFLSLVSLAVFNWALFMILDSGQILGPEDIKFENLISSQVTLYVLVITQIILGAFLWARNQDLISFLSPAWFQAFWLLNLAILTTYLYGGCVASHIIHNK